MANFAEGPRSLDPSMGAASAQGDAEVQDHVRRPHAPASLLVHSTSRCVGHLRLITLTPGVRPAGAGGRPIAGRRRRPEHAEISLHDHGVLLRCAEAAALACAPWSRTALRLQSSNQPYVLRKRGLEPFRDIRRWSWLSRKRAMLQSTRKGRQACRAIGGRCAELTAPVQ